MYAELIQRLYQTNFFSGMKLGLQNMEALCSLFAHPERAFPSVHIAGTNGKGTLAYQLANNLQRSGYKVGLYTSPHISCYRERIQVNGEMISEESIERLLPSIFDQEEVPATFFEITTMLAFLFFRQEKVDVAILETGLGGRLDATNVVTPELSVITSIGLDHCDVLGDTIEEIAKEKAGIMKPGVPVVLGSDTPREWLQQQAKLVGCPSYLGDKLLESSSQLLAPKFSIKAPLCYDLPPCRGQVLELSTGQSITLDVAHNPAAFRRLEELFDTPIRCVVGMSQGKDVRENLEILSRFTTTMHLVEAPNGRGVPVAELEAALPTGVEHRAHSSITEALNSALESGESLLVCGTFFIMGPVRRTLGIVEATDPWDMNESRTSVGSHGAPSIPRVR